MTRQSDEDRLIRVLQHHKALKRWTMGQLQSHGISSQETYGNDEKGDIVILRSEDTEAAQAVIGQVHRDFNDGEPVVMSQAKEPLTDHPHLEIKTQYLYGQEVDAILQQKTVVAIVSANKISKPSRQKLSDSGVVYAENVRPDDLNEFISE